jgi:hypothetical protein
MTKLCLVALAAALLLAACDGFGVVAQQGSADPSASSLLDAPVSAAPSMEVPPTSDPREYVSVKINTTMPIGGVDETGTCPAIVTLSFVRGGGDPSTVLGRSSLWGNCTDSAVQGIDATGSFDGRLFTMGQGTGRYTGSFDGSVATISGGPRPTTYVFVVP